VLKLHRLHNHEELASKKEIDKLEKDLHHYATNISESFAKAEIVLGTVIRPVSALYITRTDIFAESISVPTRTAVIDGCDNG